MLLSIVETMISGHQRSLAGWISHINGAAALIKVRGPEQLASVVGVRLFSQATAGLMVSCMGIGMALPEHISELITLLAKHANVSDPTWLNYELMMSLTNFRAQVVSGVISDPQDILSRALELEQTALSVFDNSPSVYYYETVYTDADPGIIFACCYHVYQDYMAATVWNGVRTIRMMLQEIIRHAIEKLRSCTPSRSIDDQYTAQYQTSTRILYQLQSEVIASVPQHLGYVSKNSNSRAAPSHNFLWSHFNYRASNPFHSFDKTPDESPMIRAMGGYPLPWALYLVGAVDVATRPVQDWVIRTLHEIGRSMGVQQAVALADRLEKERNQV